MAPRVFRSTAKEIVELPPGQKLSELVSAQTGRKGGRSEQRSWDASLPVLASLLVEIGLPEIDMVIEYPLPETSGSRADVILAGVHPETRTDNYVVVELKQWDQAELVWDSDQAVRVQNMAGVHLNPIEQVRRYCKYLRQYLAVFHEHREAVHGVVFLHNAKQSEVNTLLKCRQDRLGQLFTRDRRADLARFLLGQFAAGSAPLAADRLLASAIRPRKALLDHTFDELRGASQYTLIDNQQLAYDTVKNQVQRAHLHKEKCVVLVTGGPGSGKSLVALALLSELHRAGLRVEYATGSTAVTKTLRRKFGSRGSRDLQKLFKYYRDKAEPDEYLLDVLICDEAHRVRKTSTNRWKKKKGPVDRPQLDELMSAAYVPVFLLDEHQVVRPDEIGTPKAIREHAARKGYLVHEIDLEGQFRCGGSAEYDEWVLQLIGLRHGKPAQWSGDDFDVRIARSPQEMEDFLRARVDAGATARITAGYCWPWTHEPHSDGTLEPDVVVDGWRKPWNKYTENITGEAPPGWLWATDPRGFEQIGCIYTAQGFEYDWAGVILGPDIAVENGRLAVRREATEDSALQNKKLFDDDVEILIRNTYKVLLTRGLRGVVVYAVDPAVQALLTGLAPAL